MQPKIKILLLLILTVKLLVYQLAYNQVVPFEDGRGEVYFRFAVPAVGLDSLARFISIDAVRHDSVYAYADKDGYNAFSILGIAHQVLISPSMQHGPLPMSDYTGSKSNLSWDNYPTYQGYETLMAGFQQQYPNLCRLHNLGTLTSGRKILALHISQNPDSIQAKPAFLYSSSMHGDELVGYVLLLRLADYLLTNYGLDPYVTRLVDSIDIWISPLANPDGTYYAGNNTVFGATRYNASNVDLNRNYPDPEYGLHPDNKPWQEETQIFMAFAEAKKFSLGANIHGGAEVCNYPWDVWSRLHPDNAWWMYVCRQYADTAQFYSPFGYLDDFNNGITNGYAWYSISGGRQDYMNFFHQCREFTLEISQTKLPFPTSLNNFWNYNYRSLLNYIEQGLFGLRGKIYDSLTGQGLNAKIYILNHDQDSSWVFSRLPHGNYHRYLAAGTYNLQVSATGYHDTILSGVSITNGNTTWLDIPMLRSGFQLSGKVVYNNNNLSPMGLATVYLCDTNDVCIDSCQSEISGNFSFQGLQSRIYKVYAKPSHAWGGVNSADALAIMKHFVQIGAPITGLGIRAADVNNSGSINATDALLVQKRFVGLIAGFVIPDWVSEIAEIDLQTDTQIEIKLQCAGDADRSYVPIVP